MRVSMFVVRDGIPRLFFVLRRLAIGIDFGIILGLFWPTISLNKPLPCSLPCWRICPFSRAPLYNLLPFVDSEVISILPQRPSQGLYRYDQFCFHFFSLLSLWFSMHPLRSDLSICTHSKTLWSELEARNTNTGQYVFWWVAYTNPLLLSCILNHSHLVRIAYVTVRSQ